MNLKTYLNKLLPSSFIRSIVHAGTDRLEEGAAKKVRIINALCLITAFLAFSIGHLFYFYTGLLEIYVPAMIEGLLFSLIVVMNAFRLYNMASMSVLIVHCAGAFYFGAMLGQLINISLIVAFLFGVCFLVYSRPRHQLIGIGATLVTLALLEWNYYAQVFPAMEMPVYQQYIFRWVALPAFLLFDVIVMLYYVQENKALYGRIKTFVYKVTHEIRNQLNATFLIAQLIKREIRLDDDLKKIEPYVDLLLAANHNMRNIINNVLDMAEIEAGKVETPDMETFSLRAFLRKLVSLNKVRARTRGIRLELMIGEKMPDIIISDTLRLNLIVTNLIANAIKYADKDSVIRIIVNPAAAGKFQLAVINECPDISPERQAVLFDMFVTDKRNKHVEGTGLGLYIAKSKADALEGSLQLQSKGGITTFTLTLPLQRGEAKDIAEDVVEMDIDLSNIHVLIADDSDMNNILFSKFLGLYGCLVTTASNGLQVISKLEAARNLPEIIILDYHMPEMNGGETLLYLKQTPILRNIPVIICTGNQEQEKKLMDAGAAAILLKPIEPRTLFAAICQHLPRINEVNAD